MAGIPMTLSLTSSTRVTLATSWTRGAIGALAHADNIVLISRTHAGFQGLICTPEGLFNDIGLKTKSPQNIIS